MVTKIRHVKAVIQLRRATEPEWIERNPVLRKGEPAYSTDVNKLKIGDGTKDWITLPYISSVTEEAVYEILKNYKVEDLADGDDYATKEYVDEHGGRINSISVGGTAMEIDENKNVDIDNLILNCGTSTTVI